MKILTLKFICNIIYSYICIGKFHSLPIFFIAIFLTLWSEVSFFIKGPNLNNITLYLLALKKYYMFFEIEYTEWVGYLASITLIISFMMKNMNTLRIINSLGALLFIIYGYMLNTSWPIIITNVFILLANIYYLSLKRSLNS